MGAVPHESRSALYVGFSDNSVAYSDCASRRGGGRRRDAWVTGVAKRVGHGMRGGWKHMVGRSAVGSDGFSGLHAKGMSLQFTGLCVLLPWGVVAPLHGAVYIVMGCPTAHAAVGYSWCSRSAAYAVRGVVR